MQRLSSQFRETANFCDRFAQALSRSASGVAQLLAGQQATGRNVATGSAPDLSALLASGTSGAAAASNFNALSPGSPPLGVDDVDVNGKKLSKRAKKLLRRARDPNAPKRPPSAYLLFQNEVRDDMRQRNPDMPYKLLLGKIADAWHQLTEDERKIYQDKTNEEMKKWNLDKKDHVSGLQGSEIGGEEDISGIEADELLSGVGNGNDETNVEGQLSQQRKSAAVSPGTPFGRRAVSGDNAVAPSSSKKRSKDKDRESHKKDKKSRH